MPQALGHLMSRAWADFVSGFSTNTKGFIAQVIAFPIFLYTLTIVRDALADRATRKSGWSRIVDAVRPTRPEVVFVVAATVAYWSVWFGASVVSTIYADHRQLQEQVTAAGLQLETLRSQNRQLRDENGDLENRLALKPTVIKVPVLTPAPRPGQPDPEQGRRLAVRTELGKLLHNATAIKEECLTKQDGVSPSEAPCERAANEWAGASRKYIGENLEPSYLARFDSATGTFLSYNGAHNNENVNGIANYLTFKAAILEKFLEELR